MWKLTGINMNMTTNSECLLDQMDIGSSFHKSHYVNNVDVQRIILLVNQIKSEIN
jgi:hypothetical protein